MRFRPGGSAAPATADATGAADTEPISPVALDGPGADGPAGDGTAIDGWADQLLAAPPTTVSDEDLAAALSAPPPTARSLRLTKVLATALVLVLGFVAGILVNEHYGTGSSQVAAGPTGGRADAAGGFGGEGMPTDLPSGMTFPGTGQAGTTGTAAPTTGEVTLVDGKVIYVTQSDGTQLRVEVGDDTTIEKSSSATMSDVKEGDTVTVTGTTTDSGMTATSVEVSK